MSKQDVAIISKLEGRIRRAVNLAVDYGSTDGAHHKMWVIDQILRALTGDQYEAVVAKARVGEEGPETYDWDCGTPP